MIKKFAISALFFVLSFAVFAQSESSPAVKKKGRPDLPGTFAIDLGFNIPSEKENFNTGIFGSRTLNVYYYYDYQFGHSKFSVHPGIGIGLERYKFNNNRTLGYVAGPDSPYDTLRMVKASNVVNSSKIKKTGFITNYIDIPVEFRFSANPTDPNRSFKASLGFKFGILYDSFTKIKYTQDGETKKFKNKQNFNTNPFRYGVTARIGVGNVSLYGYYSLTPIFEKGKGPTNGDATYGDVTNFTIGLTLATF